MSDPIMDVLDEFDRKWRAGDSPDLASLIEQLRNQGDDELCVELCAADLEWKWRASHAKTAGIRCLSWPETEMRSAVGPRMRDYATLLQALMSDRSHVQRMLEAEFLARSMWGDAPRIDAFLEEANMADCFEAEFELHLVEQLDHLAQLRVGVFRSDHLLLNVRVPPQFTIGRQDRREPPEPAWLPKTSRLIVAGHDDRSVSRKQIVIRRIGIHEISLSNGSRNVGFALDNCQLQPHESTRLLTPVTIVLGDLTVKICTEC